MDIQEEMDNYEKILKDLGYGHRSLTRTSHGFADPITQFGFEIWHASTQAAKSDAVPAIDLAVQQFIGYSSSKDGTSITDLAASMGLSKDEWLEVKDRTYMICADDLATLDGFYGIEAQETSQ